MPLNEPPKDERAFLEELRCSVGAMAVLLLLYRLPIHKVSTFCFFTDVIAAFLPTEAYIYAAFTPLNWFSLGSRGL